MSDRAERVEALLEEEGVDALLVTGLVNVRYLTGFTGSNALLVLGPGIRRFVTDFRYVERAQRRGRTAWTVERAPTGVPGRARGRLAGRRAAARLRGPGDDGARSTRGCASCCPRASSSSPAGGLVERERAVKEPRELERIAAAAALADEALTEVLARGLVGRIERDVALAVEDAIRRRGAEPAFTTIVASGLRGSLPHATPSDAPIEPGTLVTIDWGARLDGYHSDCTRTYAAGEVPGELRELYELVRARAGRGAGRRAAGPARPRGGRRRARPDPRRRPRRRLRPRPRPRGRPRGPRGAAAGQHRHRPAARQATSSPSSPGCTSRARAASGSRISWRSPGPDTAC